MDVHVHQSWHQPAASKITDLEVLTVADQRLQRSAAVDSGDSAVLDEQRGVIDRR
jgi:hypothetical protein